jgi:uncharacterized OB-fold protein
MTAAFQSLPVADPDTRPFWDACREHRLRLQHCATCATPRFPPSPVCPSCRGFEHRWEEHDGCGTIHAWVTVHHPIPPSVAEVPYVVALVDLAPGVRMPARLVDVDPREVHEGMPVCVVFRDVTPEVTLPEFAPAGAS